MIDGLRRRMLVTREDQRAAVTEPAVGVAGLAESGHLTLKELTVLRLAAEGASAAETAKRLRKAVEVAALRDHLETASKEHD
jgi:hypothetical protein